MTEITENSSFLSYGLLFALIMRQGVCLMKKGNIFKIGFMAMSLLGANQIAFAEDPIALQVLRIPEMKNLIFKNLTPSKQLECTLLSNKELSQNNVDHSLTNKKLYKETFQFLIQAKTDLNPIV